MTLPSVEPASQLLSVSQVTEALNEGSIVTEVPTALVGKLLSLPCLLGLLKHLQHPEQSSHIGEHSDGFCDGDWTALHSHDVPALLWVPLWAKYQVQG